MENVVDALKIAFGILVFVIAITLALSVIGQARATSDIVFFFNDKTEFYDYATTENVEHTEDRIVGMNTILPTIHRYAKEQFAVTIYDSNGTPIVRYDLWTENFMPNWDQTLKDMNSTNSYIKNEAIKTYNGLKDRLQRVQNVVNTTLGLDANKEFKMNDLLKLYKVKSDANISGIQVGAPWLGDNEKILARVKHDMVGTDYINNMITYKGKNLKQYKDRKFKEKFLEISTSGETITDEENSLETIKGNKKLEIIYILQ